MGNNLREKTQHRDLQYRVIHQGSLYWRGLHALSSRDEGFEAFQASSMSCLRQKRAFGCFGFSVQSSKKRSRGPLRTVVFRQAVLRGRMDGSGAAQLVHPRLCLSPSPYPVGINKLGRRSVKDQIIRDVDCDDAPGKQ